MELHIDEIAPDLFRLSTYLPRADLQFNHFLLRDEEPLLFHTGMRSFFPAIHKGVSRLLDPSQLRWLAFSHYEADECGSLDQWLAVAPAARPLCGEVGAAVNIDDVAERKPRPLVDGEVAGTGRRRLRFLATPHLPHGWDSGLLFEETTQTLLCSDLFLHHGKVEPLTQGDIVGRARQSLLTLEAGPLAHSFPWTPRTAAHLGRLADLNPRCLALMHGSSFTGNGAEALGNLAEALFQVLGGDAQR